MKTLRRFIKSLMLTALVSANLVGQNKPNTEVKPTQNINLISPPGVYNNGHYINYIRSYDVLKPGLTESSILSSGQSPSNVLMTTQFMDGLGRHIQTVNRKASPDGLSDVVQAITYDQFGRIMQTYLPYKAVGNDGIFRIDPFAEQDSFYDAHFNGDEDVYYELTEFENSPLNRVTKQFAAGNSWAAGNSEGIRYEWRTNITTDGVRIWTVIGSNNPSTLAEYNAGSLMVNITIDEENNHVKEFTDKLGRVILKQVQKGTSTNNGHSDWLNTYYIYDNRGNLRYVLPPRAVELISGSWSWNATDMNELIFKYTYDGRNRMISKEVPGGGLVEMVYDNLDRLVASRDAEMEANDNWSFTKYDPLGRPVITGLYANSSSRTSIQSTVDNWNNDPFVRKEAPVTTGAVEGINITVSSHVSGTTLYKVKTGGVINFLPGFDSGTEEFETEFAQSLSHEYTHYQGYYDATFPVMDSNVEVLSVSYFDDYDFTSQTYDDSKEIEFYTTSAQQTLYNFVDPEDNVDVTGMATGSKVKVLGTTDQWLTTVMFYDDRGRVIQSQSDNHVNGLDISTTQYDFSGKVLNTYTVHNNPNASANSQTSIAKRFTYDASGTGRLLSIQEKLNGGSYKTIVTNTYNDLGQLESKTLGNPSSPLETLNYAYNVRGWLEGINEDYVTNGTGGHYFGMDLSYDFGFDVNQLNGNIAGVKWRSASSGDQRAYGFDYDASNRLTKADYSQGISWINTESDFSTNYSYDANGNITSLLRKGVVAGTIKIIDQLTYEYLNGNKSNQLAFVSDAAGALGEQGDLGQGDFVDGNTSGNDYTYDANGNMTQDKNKDILGNGDITYNHLNLPERIEFSNNSGKTIEYVYDAAGIKLRKKVSNSGVISTTDYVGGFIYENNQLQHFAHEEGRVRKNYQGNLVYDYFVKDHLGNTRMTLTEDQDVTIYRATMETDTKPDGINLQAFEESIFLNLSNTREDNNSTENTTAIEGITNDETVRLNASQTNRKIGPGKLLSVSAGDQIDIVVQSYHAGSYTGDYENSATVIAAAAASIFGGASGGGTEQQAIYDLFTGFNSATAAVYVGSDGAASRPRAYLNVLILNQDFDYVDGGFVQTDQVSGFKELSISKSINQGGYVYVYLSNENDPSLNYNVYFDDLDITHTKGAILQEDHYYPFGMNINALSSTAPLSKPNQFKYNAGTELTEAFDFDIYETPFRGYDAQLGRFMQVDAMADVLSSITPYNFGYNNPIIFNDPTGLIGEDCPDGNCGSVTVYATERARKKAERKARKAARRSNSSEGSSTNGLSLSQMSILRDLRDSNNPIERGIYAQYKKNGIEGVRNVLSHSKTLSSSTDGYEDAIAHSQKYMSQIGQVVQRGVSGTILVAAAAPMLIEALPALMEGTIASSSTIANGARTAYQATNSTLLRKSAELVVRNKSWLNKGNWWRLGKGWNPTIGARNIRLAWGSHPKYISRVPKLLRPLNKWLRKLGGGHKHFPKWK
ncbi:DUF6443 domain-containing protein [Roseivirga sp.]|uniref:DUF6443 domain-containing protein n=1 Tax=Roseivirga sp. TaxID=1964215 RepID=UPI003B8CAE77